MFKCSMSNFNFEKKCKSSFQFSVLSTFNFSFKLYHQSHHQTTYYIARLKYTIAFTVYQQQTSQSLPLFHKTKKGRTETLNLIHDFPHFCTLIQLQGSVPIL